MSAVPAGLRLVQGATVVALVIFGLPLPALPKLLWEGGENRLIGLLVLLVLGAYLAVLVLVRPKGGATGLGRGIALARALAVAAILALLALAVPFLLGREARALAFVAAGILPQVALLLGARRLLAAVPEAAASALGLSRLLLRATAGAVFAGAWLALYATTFHARREAEARRLAAEAHSLEAFARNLEVTASKLPEFLRECATRESRVALVDAILPREPLIDALAERLEALGARSRVEVVALVPGAATRTRSRSGTEHFRSPLRLSVRGRLEDLAGFVERLPRLARLVRLEAIDLRRERDRWFRADVDLAAFSLPTPAGGTPPCEKTDADRFLLAEAVGAGTLLESRVKDRPGLRHVEARYRISAVFKGTLVEGTVASVEETCLTRPPPPLALPSFFSTCSVDGALVPGTLHVLFLHEVDPRSEAPWWPVPGVGSPLVCGLAPALFAGTPEGPGFERLSRFQEAQR